MTDDSDWIEEHRLEKLAELDRDMNPGWRDRFGPGSFGYHELLDRVHCVSQMAEKLLREHPAALLDPGYFAMIDRAIAALDDLYQAVGAGDLDEPEGQSGPDDPGREDATS